MKSLVSQGKKYFLVSSFHANDWLFNLMKDVEIPFITRLLNQDGDYNFYVIEEYWKQAYELCFQKEFGFTPETLPDIYMAD